MLERGVDLAAGIADGEFTEADVVDAMCTNVHIRNPAKRLYETQECSESTDRATGR